MENWVPDAIDVESCVLGYGVMAMDFDSFPNPS